MANSRTWYSWGDYALSDCSSGTNQCKSFLWALAAAICGNIAGGSTGPAGSIPSGSKWTLYASSDSSTAGIDATDRWSIGGAFNATKLVRASSGAHSWIVLKSPSGIGGNGPYYLTIDWLSASDQTCLFFLAKAAPTGGTTSLRPTSTDETTMASALTYMDASAWTNGRCHYTVDSDGDFWFCASKNSSASISSVFCVQGLTNLRQGADSWPVVLGVDGNASGTNSLREAANGFIRGGISGLIRTKAYNPAGPTVSVSVASVGSFSFNSSTSLLQQQNGAFFADGNYEALPCTVLTTTAGLEGIKGEFQDARLIAPITTGSRVPSSGNVEKILVGSMLIPLTVVPTL